MELVIGGVSQNKLEYVINLYDDVVIIDNLQDIVRECMDEKMVYDMIYKNPDCIIICDEVGCGDDSRKVLLSEAIRVVVILLQVEVWRVW